MTTKAGAQAHGTGEIPEPRDAPSGPGAANIAVRTAHAAPAAPAIPGSPAPGADDADAGGSRGTTTLTASRTGTAPAEAPATETVEIDPADYLDGVGAFLAGPANVIMQLSWAPVGYGVVESRVESGQVTRHPVKRFRTTFSYIAVALLGTDEDRAHLRAAVNRAHAQVRSTADSPVEYHAMRPDLQLWVAACLYWGAVDLYTRLHGPMEPAVADAFYRHAARFGTTLQVRQQMWPADRAVFERYWQEALGRVSLDDTVRRYLHDLITRRSLRFPFNLGPRGPRVFLTTGFLPPRFRAEMGLAWSEEQQARFDRLLRRIGAVSRRMPRAVRLFPFNLLLWDVRRRIRQGRPLV